MKKEYEIVENMTYKDVLKIASVELMSLIGRPFNVLEIAKPHDLDYAIHLAKVVSKISPILGNMIEYNTALVLNQLDWKGLGIWKRQDPGFPDNIFQGKVKPEPGIEIKTWFPLATEITARFKDSQSIFSQENINVAVIAWLPEFLIYGKPKIIDVWIGSAKSIAEARDNHYHNPPDYLVFEPGDTSQRTSNLQQTNTNGYKFQGDEKDFKKAEEFIKKWGEEGKAYSTDSQYQMMLKDLHGKYSYRLDTNYAKMDRIEHKDLEEFKEKVLNTKYLGKPIKEWSSKIFEDEETIKEIMKFN